jgi:hypothetical protein
LRLTSSTVSDRHKCLAASSIVSPVTMAAVRSLTAISVQGSRRRCRFSLPWARKPPSRWKIVANPAGLDLLLLLSGVVRILLFSVGLFSHPHPMASHSFQTRLGLRVIHLVGAGQKKFSATPEFLSVHGGPSPALKVNPKQVQGLNNMKNESAAIRNSLRSTERCMKS